MKKKYLSTGNEACGEGAIQAGCRFYAGYPITPQNELIAYMSRRMEEEDGVFIQSESELSAANMVLGASAAGARAMTSSSSPGISLKQEAISYLAACELPAVIVNVMRGGPGLGNIDASQGDYFQATRGGGHGDYRTPVLAPASVQETYDLTIKAFDIADEYRTPVMILTDGMIGQMMEPLEFDDAADPPKKFDKPWAMTGAKGRKARSIKSLLLGENVLEKHNIKLQKKYRLITEKEIRSETYKTEDAQVILIAYGTMSRIARASIDILEKEGIKVGLIRPITLWPFPSEDIARLAENNMKILVLEMSAGQMVEDVRLTVQDDERVSFYGCMGGRIHTEEEIVAKVKELI